MYKSIIELMEHHTRHIKFDKSLSSKIKTFRITWAQKNEDTISFLGSNLMGIQPIRFTESEDNLFMVDIFKVEPSDLKNDINRVPGINKDYAVSSNAMFLLIGYAMHRFYTSKDLTLKLREDTVRELYYVFAYKAISSIMYRYFPYNVDPGLAKSTYEKLSKRYLIKQFNNWQEVFRYRVDFDILPPNGTYSELMINYSTNDAVMLLNAIQPRIKNLVKTIYPVMLDIKNNSEKIRTSTVMDKDTEDGDGGVKDIVMMYNNMADYIYNIINNPNDFINDDIIYLLAAYNKKTDTKLVHATLSYIANNIRVDSKMKNDFVSVIINKTIQYLRTNGIVNNYNKHIEDIIKITKGFWSSSSVKDKDIIETKKYINNIVRTATKKNTNWVVVNVTINVLMYIFIRALYKR